MDTDLVTEVANEVNWHMRENDLTTAEVAARMGITPGTLSMVLAGSMNMTLQMLASLGTALDARFEVTLKAAS